jgi:hypothetical protein
MVPHQGLQFFCYPGPYIIQKSFEEKFDGFWASAILLHVPKRKIDEALGKIHKNIKKELLVE